MRSAAPCRPSARSACLERVRNHLGQGAASRPPGWASARANVMEAIAEKLENKLHEWKPETSQKVRALVAEIIEQADDDALDIGRSGASSRK